MIQLSNGFQYDNVSFQPEFAEYLLATGFKVSSTSISMIIENDKHILHIKGSCVDFFEIKSEKVLPHESKYKSICSFSGLNNLDIYGWILLMHLAKVQDSNMAAMKAMNLNAQKGVEIQYLSNEVVNSLKPAV